MRIAVPCEREKIALQFGNTNRYKFYQVDHNELIRSYALSSGVDGLEENADFLKMAGVQLVICGGIGGAAIKALDSRGILIMGGIIGNADERMQEFLTGALSFRPIDPKAQHDHGGCSHHHEEGAHSCDQNCQDCTAEECTDDSAPAAGSTLH